MEVETLAIICVIVSVVVSFPKWLKRGRPPP